MKNTDFKIYSSTEAADLLRNTPTILPELVRCLPLTQERIRSLLEQGEPNADSTVIREKGDHVQEKFDRGNGVVLTVQDEIAAIADYERIGNWRGRPVFEIGDVITHPHHRGVGLSSPLRDQCMRQIVNLEPDALCLGCTKDSKLIGKYELWAHQEFCEEITGDVYEDIKSQGKGKQPMREDERPIACGWYEGCRIFVVDLKKRFATETQS